MSPVSVDGISRWSNVCVWPGGAIVCTLPSLSSSCLLSWWVTCLTTHGELRSFLWALLFERVHDFINSGSLHRLKPPLAVNSVEAVERARACIQPCLTVIQFGTVVHENKSPTISNQLKPIKWVIRASCFLINDITHGCFYLPYLHKLQCWASNNDLLLLSVGEIVLIFDSNLPK